MADGVEAATEQPRVLGLLKTNQKLLSEKSLSRKTNEQITQRKSSARSAAMDVLALEWLNKEWSLGSDVHLYLAETLLPSLILSLEKLLTRVNERGLTDEEGPVPGFNPINYLAQQLMRLNPRPMACSGRLLDPADTAGASYSRSISEVAVQLREMRVLGEQTARLRDQLKQQQLEREEEAARRRAEGDRRRKVLLGMVLVWGDEIPALQVSPAHSDVWEGAVYECWDVTICPGSSCSTQLAGGGEMSS